VAEERDGDFLAGSVAVGVEDPRAAVCTFAGKHQLAVFAVEVGTPSKEFFDPLRALFDEDVGGFGVDEPVPGGESVLVVKGYVFFSADSYCDSALRVSSIGFGEFFFGDDENRACTRETYRCAESGDSGSDDEKVSVLLRGRETSGIDGRCYLRRKG